MILNIKYQISNSGLGDREEEPGQAGGEAGEGPGQVRAD